MNRYTVAVLYGKNKDKIESIFFCDTPAQCENQLKYCFSKHVTAVAKNPNGEIIGRVIEDEISPGGFTMWFEV